MAGPQGTFVWKAAALKVKAWGVTGAFLGKENGAPDSTMSNSSRLFTKIISCEVAWAGDWREKQNSWQRLFLPGLPGDSVIKNLPSVQETQARSLAQRDSLEEGMSPVPVFLPGESHGQRSLVGYSPGGRMEPDVTQWLHHHHHCSCQESQNWDEERRVHIQAWFSTICQVMDSSK